jgi:hypothetical protein
VNLTIYEEPATITSTSTFSSGGVIDIGVGLRVWRNLTVGIAYTQDDNTSTGELTGTIPNPVFFNRPRTLDQDVPGLKRKERAAHLQLGWVFPLNDKVDFLVFGGPTFFRFEQDVVSDMEIVEQGGTFTTVAVDPEITTRKKSVIGFNLGVDATYILWSNDDVRLGAGGFFRYAGATTTVKMLASDQSTDVGGLQVGFGGRLRF